MCRPPFRQCIKRVVSSLPTRPPDNELYDRGCDLVEAAASIRRLAAGPRAARAMPAVLGCIEAAWQRLRAVTDRMRRGFDHLECALNDAEVAATATRSLAARSLGA